MSEVEEKDKEKAKEPEVSNEAEQGQEEKNEGSHDSSIDVLAQNEIDLLMQQVSTEQTGIVYDCHGKRISHEKKVNIRLYNFRSPSYLREIEIRQIQASHEQFAKHISLRLSMFLQVEVEFEVQKIQAVSFEKFIESRRDPTFASLFNLTHLPGVGILDMNTLLAMSIVNRMLGGKGKSLQQERVLTEIESALMEEVVLLILEEWCGLWKSFKQINPSIIGRESDPRYLQTSLRDAVTMVISMNAQFNDCFQPVTLAISFAMLEPILRYIQAKNNKYIAKSSALKEKHWTKSYDTIDVPAYAQLQPQEIKMSDILNLRPGDVFEFPSRLIEQTELKIMNTPCFIGEVGVNGGHVAFRIKDKIKTHPCYGNQRSNS